jgi:hypothetical protein
LFEIHDNFMEEHWLDDILQSFIEPHFPWFYMGKTSDDEAFDGNKHFVKDYGQFSHLFVANDQMEERYYDHFVKPIVDKLQTMYPIEKIERAKVNLITPMSDYPSGCYHMPHYDNNPNYELADNEMFYTFLYYMSDTDGSTYFFNEKSGFNGDYLTIDRILEPKKNCGVMFDSTVYHASSVPTLVDNNPRIAMNLVFIGKKLEKETK